MTARSQVSAEVRLDTRTDESGSTVLQIIGRLDVDSAASIWDAAVKALPGTGNAELDASELEYCDGVGMTLIHDLAIQQRRAGGTLTVTGLRDDLESFLALTELERDLTERVAPAPTRLSFPQVVGTRTYEICGDVKSLVSYVGEISSALAHAIAHPHQVRWKDALGFCTTVGAFALPVVVLIGFLLGWVMAFSAAFIMDEYGADQLLAALIGPAMVRELGPLMTCIVLAARSGSAFAAEIGMMKVNEEIDALSTMGLDPVRFLVTPRIIAAICMTPILTAFANLAGIIGGALVSTFVLDQPLVIYTNLLQQVVTIEGISLGLVKALIFGTIVAAIGCIRGMQTANSPTAVGESTTSAVVTAIVFLAITDAILAVIVQVLGI